MIVTSMDTATSLMAGITIFAILGNLAYESGSSDVGSVTKGGSGLAFISYPDAIAKFEVVPQVCFASFWRAFHFSLINKLYFNFSFFP